MTVTSYVRAHLTAVQYGVDEHKLIYGQDLTILPVNEVTVLHAHITVFLSARHVMMDQSDWKPDQHPETSQTHQITVKK